jgi:putative methionine-R-sulfoxide reductase with GAF domain
VQSEACLPLLDAAQQVAGIIDAEAKPRAFFGPPRLATLAALAIVASAVLP